MSTDNDSARDRRLEELAHGPLDDTDVRILDELGDLFDILDPVPMGLVDEVRFALSLEAMHAELAEISSQELATVRAEAGLARPTETVTFAGGAMSLMIRVTVDLDDPGLRTVDAWVTGGGIGVDLVQGVERTAQTSDAHGRLSWARVPAGPTRFLIHPVGDTGSPVVTPVVEL